MCLISYSRLRQGAAKSSDAVIEWLEGSERRFTIACMEVSEACRSAMSLLTNLKEEFAGCGL